MKPDRSPLNFVAWLKEGARLDSETCGRIEKLALSGQHKILDVLLQFSSLNDAEIAALFCEFLELGPASLPERGNHPTEEKVPRAWQIQNMVIARRVGEDFFLYLADPFDDFVISAAEYTLESQAKLMVLPRSKIMEFYSEDQYAHQSENEDAWIDDDENERLKELSSQTPTVKMVSELLSDAVRLAASDIHIEPVQNAVNVRLRVGGELQLFRSYERSKQQALVSRIKVLANLNLAERRLPQDGRCRVIAAGETRDFRVATMPSIFGETIVLRILNRDASKLSLEALGLGDLVITQLLRLINLPNGLILISGPTGSGKTTTLYALLGRLDAQRRKIFTIEDPIEYRLEGITQTQVETQIGLTYANALRSVLRHDPDVILVGEIRDRETASIAVQAAMTGHLVLATVHTNSAIGAVSRLRDMGIEPYLLAGSLKGVIGQRLARKRNSGAKQQTQLESRQAVCEILEMSSSLVTLIGSGATEDALLDEANSLGFRPLRTVISAYVETGVLDNSSLSLI